MTRGGAIEGGAPAGSAETVRRIEVAHPVAPDLALEAAAALGSLDDTTIHTRQTRPSIEELEGLALTAGTPSSHLRVPAEPAEEDLPSSLLRTQEVPLVALESSVILDDPDDELLLADDLRSEAAPELPLSPDALLVDDDSDLLESGELEALHVDGEELGSASGSVHVVLPDFTDATAERHHLKIPEEERATLYLSESLEKAARAPSVIPPPPPHATGSSPRGAFRPPVLLGGEPHQAHLVAAPEEEVDLAQRGDFTVLLAVLRSKLEAADDGEEKAAVLLRTACVQEFGTNDRAGALTTLESALQHAPNDPDIVAALDRLARALGSTADLAARVRERLPEHAPEKRVPFFAHLVYWYEQDLDRPDDAAFFVKEIERFDQSHPVVLERAARRAAKRGDGKTERDFLRRAEVRTISVDRAVPLYIALARSHAGMPDTRRAAERGELRDADVVFALRGMEAIGREREDFAQLSWALSRLTEVLLSPVERKGALLKLAELEDSKFLRRERAAELYLRVLELEPNAPAALKGLERCWHALRRWRELADVFRRQAFAAKDDRTKLARLELATEVYENKLGDEESALTVLHEQLVIDPKHRRALSDLARIYEKQGDWTNVALERGRLARLEPNKRLQATKLVELGHFLASPDRDPAAAKHQYESAIEIDGGNLAAWEALEKIALAEDDRPRIAECLAARAKATQGGAARAQVYVELATRLSEMGDEARAREAYEAAIKADPTCEIAAARLVDGRVREERFREALPLIELLAAAAHRDGEREVYFERLRLQTRVASAVGDFDRALSSAMSAMELRSSEPLVQEDLVGVATQHPDRAAMWERAKTPLLLIAETSKTLPDDVVVPFAKLLRGTKALDAAVKLLDRAQTRSPSPTFLAQLAEVFVEKGDYERAGALVCTIARAEAVPETRVFGLVTGAEILLSKAHKPELAAQILEEAREVSPFDARVLGALSTLYQQRGDYPGLVSVLESMIEAEDDVATRVEMLFGLAALFRERLPDVRREVDALDRILDADKTRLQAFEQISLALTNAKEWSELEKAYRRMLARVVHDGDEGQRQLKFVLFSQLGLIYRDRLGDADRSYEAFAAAAHLKPEDAGVRKMVTELLVVTDNLDDAVTRTRELIARDPFDAELYQELYELFLRQHEFDKAWCAVDVLGDLRELGVEQRQFLQDYPPFELGDVPGQLVEQAWLSHLLSKDLDPILTRLLSRMTPIVARMRHAQRHEAAIERVFTAVHSHRHDAIRQMFGNAAEILGIEPPPLLLGDPASGSPFTPALSPFGAIEVSVPALESQAESLLFVIGKRLAEQRPELLPHAFFPSVTELTALLGAAVRVSRDETANDALGRALDLALSSTVNREELADIQDHVDEVMRKGGLVDVRRWSRAAELSGLRAGLLLTGKVKAARTAIATDRVSASDVPPREKLGEVYQFAVGDLYSELRQAIGVAVRQD